jgi:preprotein translocase subunit SecY
VVRKDVDHIPFKVNPLGVQPVLVAVFMCEGMVWLMNVMDPPGFIRAATEFVFSSASPMYYLTFFLIVFGFSYLDLQDTPKDVSEYMVKIGARIPEVRPGEATVRYLTTLQNGSRFFGGLLLGIVAVACTMMDQWMKATVGISVGFTSMLIVVSTILQIQRQVVALAQMPKLDRVIRSL